MPSFLHTGLQNYCRAKCRSLWWLDLNYQLWHSYIILDGGGGVFVKQVSGIPRHQVTILQTAYELNKNSEILDDFKLQNKDPIET